MRHLASSLCVVAALLAPVFVHAQVPAAPTVPPPAAVPPTAPAAQPAPPSRWTPAQIRQSFEMADRDSNGQLTRAEAQHLTIMPGSFEDADQNKDGVVVLGEYEAQFLR